MGWEICQLDLFFEPCFPHISFDGFLEQLLLLSPPLQVLACSSLETSLLTATFPNSQSGRNSSSSSSSTTCLLKECSSGSSRPTRLHTEAACSTLPGTLRSGRNRLRLPWRDRTARLVRCRKAGGRALASHRLTCRGQYLSMGSRVPATVAAHASGVCRRLGNH